MSSYNVAKPQRGAGAYLDKDTIYVNSDKYFNSHNDFQMYEDMGYDVQPVDLHGGFVPENKGLGNLKKTEKAIQERFALDKPE